MRKSPKNLFSCVEFNWFNNGGDHLFVGQLSAWSFPRLVLLFQSLRSGEPTHRRRLAHWKPFQEMTWWRYLLQLWLCLYFWLNSHWKPASSAIVFLYLLWFHVVCKGKGKVYYGPQWPIRPVLIPGFCSMKRLGVFLLPPGWDASQSQGYPQHSAGTHLYTWVERGTVRVKCLA